MDEPRDVEQPALRRVVAPWHLATLLVALAVVAAAVGSSHREPFLPPPWSPRVAIALVALFAATEIFSVHVHFSNSSHSFSVVEVAVTLGLFFVAPTALVATHVLGGGLALALHRRQRPVKLAFNVASFVLGDTLAITVFRSLAGAPGRFTGRTMLAAGAGTIAAAALTAGLVVLAIGLCDGRWDVRLVTSAVFGCSTATVATSLGLIAVGMIAAYPQTAWVLLVPTVGLYLANRAYTNERRRLQSLQLVHDTSRLLRNSIDELDAALAGFVQEAQRRFHCGFVELLYHRSADDHAVDVVRDGDADCAVHRGARNAHVTGLVSAAHLTNRPATLVTRSTGTPADRAYLEAAGLDEAIVALVSGDTRAPGVLVIGTRARDVQRLTRDDVVVVETLAANVVAALENGRLEQSVGQLQAVEQRLTHQATHDSLTGLANRSLFIARVTDALDIAATTGLPLAALFIDLDDFKTVNDTLGHSAGDELLVVLARRLANALPPDAVGARLGGDEFAVLLPGVSSSAAAEATARQVLEALACPVSIGGHLVPVRASIGCATSAAGQDAATLLRNADTAMYAAKGGGKNCVVSFGAGHMTLAAQPTDLLQDMEIALLDRQFTAHFQPVVELATGRIVGAEALARWQHPALGLLSPATFLGPAGRHGMLAVIGQAVLLDAALFAAQLDAALGVGGPIVSVNLSAGELSDPGLAARIVATAGHASLDPARLAFEVDGHLLVDPAPELLTNLRALTRSGCALTVDEFGEGYWSIGQLDSLGVGHVKIARSIVERLGRAQGGGERLVGAIGAMAAELGCTVVAKGVERAPQVEILRGLGVGRGQGFHFAPALSPGVLLRRAAERVGAGDR